GVGGYGAEVSGWCTGFYLFGILGVALGGVLVLFLREPGRRHIEAMTVQSTVAAARELFAHRIVCILVVVFAGANFVAMIFLTWIPAFLKARFDMSIAIP